MAHQHPTTPQPQTESGNPSNDITDTHSVGHKVTQRDMASTFTRQQAAETVGTAAGPGAKQPQPGSSSR